MTTCSHCGKILHKTPTVILGMTLGPECAQKFSGLAAYLETHGIELPQTFPMIPNTKRDAFTAAPELLELRGRAARLGVKLRTEQRWGANPTDTVTGIESADPSRFVSSAEIRSEFQASLERAS